MPVDIDQAMRLACEQARQWLGATSPNPAVGAVALRIDGSVLASAAHQKAGTPHAEAALIQWCRDQNILDQIHTLVVTLEPCNHQGRTPPCTDAIIATGIKHVVIGATDPNPHVKGGGIERLQNAGIKITTGNENELCRQLIAPFVFSASTGKPWITLKRALDRNGSMIPPAGQKTFTSPQSLQFAHRLRKKADAIITGSGTILADNPLFTVRHVEDFPGKRRHLAIIDRRKRVGQDYIDQAKKRGLDVVIHDNPTVAIADLHQKGVQDILVEAGPALTQHLMDQGLWNIKVTIRQSDPADQIDTAFNRNELVPFQAKAFDWNNFLPA